MERGGDRTTAQETSPDVKRSRTFSPHPPHPSHPSHPSRPSHPSLSLLVTALLGALLSLAPACGGDDSQGGLTFDTGTDTFGPDAPGLPDEDAAGGEADVAGKPDATPPDVPTTAADVRPEDVSDVPVICAPGERVCLATGAIASRAWVACNADGTAWGREQPCSAGEVCLQGVCLTPQCAPGQIVCAEAAVLVCAADGLSWEETACEDEFVCFAGACVECVNADQCEPGEVCGDDGRCAPEAVTVRPPSPPIGMVGEAYAYAFEARGGLPPYVWSAEGTVPTGLTVAEDGVLEGVPSAAGTYAFTVVAEDGLGTEGTAAAAVTIEPRVEGVRITTSSPLPEAEEGEAYQVQLRAAGGTPPYAWLINVGQLPAGLRMDATGLISGTPDMAVGDFPFRVRVFDNGDVPTWDQRELTLRVRIAPLEIIGNQEYNLLVTKVIVLPLLTFIPNLPLLPYDTQLQAKGGLRPYHWTEQEIPSWLNFLIPRSGIPQGLTLEEGGRLRGNVSSTEEVIEITIPFTQITLRGFFFVGEVADSQSPAARKTALFLIPTLPIGAK
jgi:hypothetical protein